MTDQEPSADSRRPSRVSVKLIVNGKDMSISTTNPAETRFQLRQAMLPGMHPADYHLLLSESLFGIYQFTAQRAFLDHAVEECVLSANCCQDIVPYSGLPLASTSSSSPMSTSHADHTDDTVDKSGENPSSILAQHPPIYYWMKLANCFQTRLTLATNHGSEILIEPDSARSLDDARKQYVAYLDQTIGAYNRVLEFPTESSSVRLYALNQLGLNFWRRLQFSHSLDDIERSIAFTCQVDDGSLTPTQQAGCWHRLADLFFERYRIEETSDNLEYALNAAENSIAIFSEHGPDQVLDFAFALLDSSKILGHRGAKDECQEDLNRAFEMSNQAVSMMDQHDCRYEEAIFNRILWSRYRLLDDSKQSTLAVGGLRCEIVDFPQALASKNHNNLTDLHVQHLSEMRYLSWTETEPTLEMLKQAAENADGLAKLAYPGSANFANLNMAAGQFLFQRFRKTEEKVDSAGAVAHFKKVYRTQIRSPMRVRAAQMAAMTQALERDWTGASATAQDGLIILSSTIWELFNSFDMQKVLSSCYGLASLAATSALRAGEAPATALQRMELGGGVVAGLLMSRRVDVTNLKVAHSELATRFETLRDELSSQKLVSRHLPAPKTSIFSFGDQAARTRRLHNELNSLTTEIRNLPGFEDFLQEPSDQHLMAAASNGPIIVVAVDPNAGSHAILVEASRIRSIQLEGLKPYHVWHQLRKLQTPSSMLSILVWLWMFLCKPCLDALSISAPTDGEEWTHVCWIPVGPLKHFPLHAAGYHLQDWKESVLDRVVSSYSTSVKALIHAQRMSALSSDDAAQQRTSALMVGMHTTKGMATLDNAPKEIDILRAQCHKLGLEPREPHSPLKENILKHLPSCKIFHFAGHGKSHPSDPFKAKLFLEDGIADTLTVEEIQKLKSTQGFPFLAYLSACSTGAIDAGELVFEGMHLISAFQLIGFRNVIGTLWEVEDERCVEIADILYSTLEDEGMTGKAVARGLHKATTALRNRQRDTHSERSKDVSPESDTNAGEAPNESRKFKAKIVPTEQDATEQSSKSARDGNSYSWVPFVHYGG